MISDERCVYVTSPDSAQLHAFIAFPYLWYEIESINILVAGQVLYVILGSQLSVVSSVADERCMYFLSGIDISRCLE